MAEGPVSTDFSRVVAFTDGVFAIAITLLVLAFEVPEADRHLTERLLEQWPQLFAYFLSFAVVGTLWVNHHRFFATLHRFDLRLLTLNLGYLSLIVLVPFPTELLGDHGGKTIAPVTYALVLGLAASLNWLMIRHTLARRHVREEARAMTEPYAAPGMLAAPAIFFASIPVAFISPYAAELMWLLSIPATRVTRRRP